MKIGLALGGGVVRGATHLGVLSTLLEANIQIDYIAGTSAGSIMAGLFASGKSPEQIYEFTQGMGWSKFVRPTLNKRGFISFARMEPLLNEFINDVAIEDFPIPCAIVATDMNEGIPYVFSAGQVGKAVRASSSIPGVVVPVELNGRLLCDGGVSNNCPVDVLRDMGADYVIAVDLFTPEKPRFGLFGVLRSTLLTSVRSSGGGIHQADCLIVPDLAGKSFVRFSQTDEFIQLGKEATLAQLEKIKDDISK
ncbi:MAG: patatin-like phospholipase family protein [Chloroflexota bacterium]